MITKPTKMTPDKIEIAIRLAQKGETIIEICRFLGISKQTIYNWGEAVPEFKQAIDRERAEAKKKELESVKKSLYKLTQPHKTKKVKETYDADNNFLGKTVETIQVDPDVKAIGLYLERNEETDESKETDKKPGFYFSRDEEC